MSNVRVALDTLRPAPRFQPGFVEIDLRGYDPLQCWEAACLISMTPGTLAIDMEAGSDKMLVHSLYLYDPEQTRLELETLVRQSLGTP